MSIKEDQRKRALSDYVDKVVALAPPLTNEQIDFISTTLRTGRIGEVRQPNPRAIEIRKAEDALAKTLRQFKDALNGCHGCGLSRNAHTYQRDYGMGYHQFSELTPDDTMKVATTYKSLISDAEKALEDAKASRG